MSEYTYLFICTVIIEAITKIIWPIGAIGLIYFMVTRPVKSDNNNKERSRRRVQRKDKQAKP